MLKNGNITLLGEIRGLKPQRLAADPQAGDLREGLVWVNTTEKALKWYDGTSVLTVATGGTLDDYPYAPKVSESGRDAVTWAWNNGLITEKECVWYPTQAISRAQVALLLMRYDTLIGRNAA